MTVSSRMIRGSMLGAMLLLVLAPVAQADEAALKERMAELEARQVEMLEEMKALREQPGLAGMEERRGVSEGRAFKRPLPSIAQRPISASM